MGHPVADMSLWARCPDCGTKSVGYRALRRNGYFGKRCARCARLAVTRK